MKNRLLEKLPVCRFFNVKRILKPSSSESVAESKSYMLLSFILCHYVSIQFYVEIELWNRLRNKTTILKREPVSKSTRHSTLCDYVDLEVVAETQVLFAWRKRDDRGQYQPRAILRDYMMN